MSKAHSLVSGLFLGGFLALLTAGCNAKPAQTQAPAEEVETLSRTEFTDRIENFFEYEPLKAAKASQFLIHLTDLSDGFPVEKAEVTLRARSGDRPAVESTARVGKVTGIYVANLTLPAAGAYEIEFHIKNAKLDERLSLSGFQVE
jgi:hypothetical protein